FALLILTCRDLSRLIALTPCPNLTIHQLTAHQPLVSTFHLELTITSNPSAVLHDQPHPHHQPTIHRLPLTIPGSRLLASRPVLRPFLTSCNRACACASASITTATTTTLAKVIKLGLLLE
ncbi:hypothetical protein CABS01_08500, partial [Colletotrichum abscissum]